ncbi:MAG: tetratricopeptide repeat protein [Pseudomonadales bacterium]|nr:tetratricopeptide repeat protein [Pseudomonadales bacterium]
MSLNVNKTLLKAKSLAKKGDLEAAASLFNTVLDRFPGNQQAIRGLQSLDNHASPGNRAPEGQLQKSIESLVNLYNAGSLAQAIQLGERLASRYPDEPIVHNVLGAANAGLSRHEQAIGNFSRAIQLLPAYSEAYNNMGTALNELGRHEHAIAAYTEAIRITPGFFEAHNNLGNVLKDTGRYAEAITCYENALSLKPDFADAHHNLGSVLTELGQHESSIASFAKALQYRPVFPGATAKLLHQQAHICEWGAMGPAAASVAELGVHGDGVPPFLLLHMEDNPARHRQRSETFTRSKFQRHDLPRPRPPKTEPERLKIGYFSADFHNHATMYLMARLLELHDPDRFVIQAYSYGPDSHDAMRERLEKAVAAVHDVRGLSDRAVAELARSENVDIAVDLKGFTQHARPGIFAYRAAPLQISYLGYPGTMGAPFMDYIIADEFVIPARQREHYSEQIIYLPDSYQVNDSLQDAPGRSISRLEAGLPEKGFVFCCFNNNYKITPREFDIWMRLLHQVEESVLWLIRANAKAVDNLRREAEARGIDPARLIFAERVSLEDHLARHRLADLFLDTFNYNAHTTASDALRSGVPAITLPGQGFAARVGGSLLNAVGLPELVASSEQEYEQMALDLALNPERLRALKDKLATALPTAPLFNTGLFCTRLEEAYQQAYLRYFRGEAPATFFVAGGE